MTGSSEPEPARAETPIAALLREHRTELTFLAAGLTAFLGSRVLARWPGIVETLFVGGWARALIPPFSRFTGAVPFPAAEALVAGYVGLRIWTAYRAGRRVVRGQRRPASTLASGVALALRDLGIGLLLFYLLWGFHYARAPVAERLELPSAGEVTTSDLHRLADEMVDLANASYRELHGAPDAGVPTSMPEDWQRLEGALAAGWARTVAHLPLGPLATARYGPPKRLVTSRAVAYLGITGFYFPFTAEPLVVGTTPAVLLGLGLAHEQAHQRGVTDEGAANFIGFVVASESGHPLLRYSAALRAQSRLLSALARRDSAAVRELAEGRLPGVRRDLEDLRAYRARHRGSASRLTTRVNDAYLRANRVPGGVESYDQATRLLLRYARLRGGTLSP